MPATLVNCITQLKYKSWYRPKFTFCISINFADMNTKYDWLDISEYPFKPHYLQIDGQQMHYIDEGKGEILLFVHGTPSWSYDFRHLISSLNKNYRCIAIDHIGFGLSDKPKNYNYTTRNHSSNLEQFISELQLKNITLIMHDFGAPIGFKYAAEHPENIKGIVVLNAWLWNSEKDADYLKMKKILKSPLLPFLYRYINFSARFVLPASFYDKSIAKKQKLQYTKPFSNSNEREGTIGFAKSLLNDQKYFGELWNLKHILKTKPILFIWGMQDPVIKPKNLDTFISGFPNAEVCRIEDAGHFPQEEKPELCINAIEKFLYKKA